MLVYVDLILLTKPEQIVLIDRGVSPYGWAMPGGEVDHGESLAEAAVREAFEETGLQVSLTEQFCTYSFADTHNRCTGTSTVYIGACTGIPRAGSDAGGVNTFCFNKLPQLIASHQVILTDYLHWLRSGIRPEPMYNLPSCREIGVPLKAIA